MTDAKPAAVSSMPTTGGILLDNVGYVYDDKTPWAHQALENISFTIDPGSRILIVGENGSGKSTLAWILAGLYKPTIGQAIRADKPLVEQTPNLGFLIQHTRLQLLSPTVGQEFSTFGITGSDAQTAMRSMGITNIHLSTRLENLSVGQQRRVGLAVLFARECPVIILDEPLAGLDRQGQTRIAEAVNALPHQTTVVTVTHDFEASAPLATDAIELTGGSVSKVWSL